MIPVTETPKSFTSATSPLMGAPAYAYGEPALYKLGCWEASLIDDFDVDPAGDLHDPLTANTLTTNQATSNHGQSRFRSLSDTGQPFDKTMKSQQCCYPCKGVVARKGFFHCSSEGRF